MNTVIYRRYRVIANTGGSLVVPAGGGGGGGITFDTADQSPNFDTAVGGTTLTHSYTMGSVTNGYLLVGVWSRLDAGEPTVSSATYNGVAMDILQTLQVASGGRLTLCGLKNPASGTHNIVITMSGSISKMGIGVTSWGGVNQTTPTGTPVTNSGDNSTPATVTVSSATGEVVVDFVFSWQVPVSGPQVGQTQRFARQLGNGNFNIYGSSKAGAASTTLGWDLNTPTDDDWQVIAVALKP